MKKIASWIRNNPHCLACLYFIFYCIHFLFLENFVRPIIYIHHPLDDLIPFVPAWVVFYFLWFPYFIGSLAYFLFKDKEAFLELCFAMFLGMSFCLLCQTLIPNGLDLRVEITSTDIFSQITRFLQKIDTPTNVCPSIHVASSLTVALAINRYSKFRHPVTVKSLSMLTMSGICLSTMFLKQHSVIDVFCGILVSLILYLITYHTNWKAALKKTFLKKLF